MRRQKNHDERQFKQKTAKNNKEYLKFAFQKKKQVNTMFNLKSAGVESLV